MDTKERIEGRIPARYKYWMLLLALTALLRLPSILHPMTIDDEGVYSTVAHELLDGGAPYLSAVERKPPLLFWIYEAVFFLFGKYNWTALHLVALAWTVLTMLTLSAIATRLFSWRAGLAAALLYSICTTRSDWVNLGFNGEIIMNLPIVCALFLAFTPGTSPKGWEPALAGVLLACAFLIKQPAAIAAIPVGIYLLLPSYRRARELRLRDSFVQAGVFTSGYFLTIGIVCLLLYHWGILGEAYYWAIGDHDIPHGPTDPVFWQRLLTEAACSAAAWQSLIIFCAVSFLERFRRAADYWKGLDAEFTALSMLLGASWIGVCASGRFYSHYFFQLLPALVLLGAPAMAAIWTGTRSYRSFLLRPSVTKCLLLATAVSCLIVNTITIWPMRTPNPLSRYVREHSGAQDRVFYWGQGNWFYAEAQRRPASRYIAYFPLTGYIFGSPTDADPSFDTSHRILPGAWNILEEDFKKTPPVLFVDADPCSTACKYPPSRYPYLQEMLARQYEVVFSTSDGTVYRRIPGPEGPSANAKSFP